MYLIYVGEMINWLMLPIIKKYMYPEYLKTLREEILVEMNTENLITFSLCSVVYKQNWLLYYTYKKGL